MLASVAATEARIEIVGERRRVHDAAFRARVAAEALAPGARAQDLARRHGVCTSLIYRWRRDAMPREGAAAAVRPETARLTPHLSSCRSVWWSSAAAYVWRCAAWALTWRAGASPPKDRCGALTSSRPRPCRNADLKQAVARKPPAGSKHDLKRTLINHMRSLLKRPDRIRSCFGHHTFRYAA